MTSIVNRQYLNIRTISVGAVILTGLILLHNSPTGYTLTPDSPIPIPTSSNYSLPLLTPAPAIAPLATTTTECNPLEYSSGRWILKNPLPDGESDVFMISGFEGCASNWVKQWHMVKLVNQTTLGIRRKAGNWRWEAGPGCTGREEFDRDEFLRNLVVDGGWFLVGDSVTQQHFFSLSCILYPDVIATPTFEEDKIHDRDSALWQHLYLSPQSPLIHSINFPDEFEIGLTPLVSFKRSDVLFSKEELDHIYFLNQSEESDDLVTIFSEETLIAESAGDYLAHFIAPFPYHYSTLIVSTAGQWSPATTFRIPGGRDELMDVYRLAMKAWLKLASQKLFSSIVVDNFERKIVIRSYTPGHEDCHAAKEPWSRILPYSGLSEIYNWDYIGRMNDIFEEEAIEIEDANIHFLKLDRPARLRPDAHALWDCLHIAVGTGVIEGWTDYIAYFLENL